MRGMIYGVCAADEIFGTRKVTHLAEMFTLSNILIQKTAESAFVSNESDPPEGLSKPKACQVLLPLVGSVSRQTRKLEMVSNLLISSWRLAYTGMTASSKRGTTRWCWRVLLSRLVQIGFISVISVLFCCLCLCSRNQLTGGPQSSWLQVESWPFSRGCFMGFASHRFGTAWSWCRHRLSFGQEADTKLLVKNLLEAKGSMENVFSFIFLVRGRGGLPTIVFWCTVLWTVVFLLPIIF